MYICRGKNVIYIYIYKKVKGTRYRSGVAQRVGSYSSSMTAAIEGGEWSAACPGRTLPPGKSRYPLYRRLGGPQGRSGRSENLVPTGIRSQTVQPVAQSLYRLSYPAHICICAGGATLYYSTKPPAGGHNCILASFPLKWWWLQLRRLYLSEKVHRKENLRALARRTEVRNAEFEIVHNGH